VNPARDLGPRLLAWSAGFGMDVFNNFNHFFWVPIVGPTLGAIFGISFYEMTIGAHNKEKKY
jgi:glycerol uptake facilitator-like aquaporin